MSERVSAEESAGSGLDYDFPPVAELEIDDTQYRVDPGFRGAIAVSARSSGTWTWAVVAEGRWDGVRLKAKTLDRTIVAALERALRASAERDAADG